MAKLFLLLGGNLGDKKKLFKNAISHLESELGKIIGKSSVYETEPWGFESDDMFWNLVVEIETSLEPENVLRITQKIENELGRTRKAERYTSRLIDIDILFYDDLILNKPELVIPHPQISERRFALEPIAEIAPELKHPIFKKSIQLLLMECPDKLFVKKLTVEI